MSEQIYLTMPKITCVTVTKNRSALLRESVACYLRQTYPNKELLIVSQSGEVENRTIKQFLHELNRSDISFFEAPAFLSLGQLRNLSTDLVTGEIICQWDDDDLYHPDRIKAQYKAMSSDSRAVASVHCDFLKYFKNSGELYWCDWSGESLLTHKYLCGSIMFYKRIFDQYNLGYPMDGRQTIVEEDLNLMCKLSSLGKLMPVFGAHLYIYIYHGENTYHLKHHEFTLDTTSGKTVMGSEFLLSHREFLCNALRLSGVRDNVMVRSKDEVAFLYESKGEYEV